MYKAFDKWLIPYLRRDRIVHQPNSHVIICFCDHFEPLHATDKAGARERLSRWKREFPIVSEHFAQQFGQPLKWSFFYPIEQYDADILDDIAELCRTTRSEVELHHHHRDDNAENLRRSFVKAIERFRRHGFLANDEEGRPVYGFVHGNWALDNSHPQGRNCGVTNELQVLLDTGCYADFTLPSAPDPCQTKTVNSIYYARPTDRPKSHDQGRPVQAGTPPDDESLLVVQGPLGLNWRRRKWGLMPRIENADLTAANPPCANRFRLWYDLGIHVDRRPDWIFIKLHTHGALPANTETLLGRPMLEFANALVQSADELGADVHFTSAREMVNIIHAAEDGNTGDPESYRDYRLTLTP